MKWEYWVQYLFLPSGKGLLKALNEAGEKGWELVSATNKDDAYTLFWKRQKPY